jgi:hypothetical protein
VWDGWLEKRGCANSVAGLVMRLKDCTPKLGLEMSLEVIKLELLENTVVVGVVSR